ncbi:MAG: DUF2806 domain-containing protein [Succinivibrio sp.]|nr:DUF2806 domain-containing protein [Succinivibrio sp.]
MVEWITALLTAAVGGAAGNFLSHLLISKLPSKTPKVEVKSPEIKEVVDHVAVEISGINETLQENLRGKQVQVISSDGPKDKNSLHGAASTTAQFLEIAEHSVSARKMSNFLRTLVMVAVRLESEGLEPSKELLNTLSAEFTNDWRDGAMNLEDEDLRKMWAELMAREVTHHGSVSRRTLQVCRNLNSEEGHLFEKAAAFVVEQDFVVHRDDSKILSLEKVLTLMDAGLLLSATSLGRAPKLAIDRKLPVPHQSDLLFYSKDLVLEIWSGFETKGPFESQLTGYKLTEAGRQLLPLIKVEPCREVFEEIFETVREGYPKAELSVLKVVKWLDDGRFTYEDKPLFKFP